MKSYGDLEAMLFNNTRFDGIPNQQR